MSAKVIVVIILFAAAVGGAVTLAFIEGGLEYRSVPYLTSSGYSGERVKMRGQILSIQNKFKPVEFTCIDIPPEGEQPPQNPAVMQVIYEGDDVPTNLKQAAHVTMEGRYDAKRGAFVATLLQTQCPSKYEGKTLTTANQPQPAP